MPYHSDKESGEMERGFKGLSPFELKNKLISLASQSQKKKSHLLLNAGRGNPNWTAAAPREAFFALGQFAVQETKRTWSEHDLAGMPGKEGISRRLYTYLLEHRGEAGIDLLGKIVDYGLVHHRFDADGWVHELVDGIIGDNYPLPDRMLIRIEQVVHDYLIREMCQNEHLMGKFRLFAVEGGTAAMCYIFDSLVANHLLTVGDKIALMVPTFTPYLEIPHLSRYNFNVEYIKASSTIGNGIHTWQYPNEEIDKLADPSIKALFVVNPSNPPSVAIQQETLDYLIQTVKRHNPHLMIITDDVYGTFVDDFQSLMEILPHNTICVYSFSKYFGATGWRLGVVAIHETNIYDKLLQKQPEHINQDLKERYSSLSTRPEEIRFIDRMVADSRQVALNHTAGLSTPQQVQMVFFAIFAILDKKNRYKEQTKAICRRRKKLLFQSLGLPEYHDPYSSAYYFELDLLELAKLQHGNEFTNFLTKNFEPIDILFRLAEESSIVLLNGNGFHAPDWSIRTSLANLNDESYSIIGKTIKKTLEYYVNEYKKTKPIDSNNTM